MKNKKTIIAIVSVVAIIFLGLGIFFWINSRGMVAPGKVDALEYGMSTTEVIDRLGKPISETTSNAEISEKIYSDYNMIKKMIALSGTNEFEDEVDALNKIYVASEGDKTVKHLLYSKKGSEGKVNVNLYFIGGSLEYISGRETANIK